MVVGVDRYARGVPPLRGCVKDAERFQRVLVDSFQVDPADIRRLDNPGKAEVVRTFREHLIARAGNDDSVIFFFSGHGTQLPDLDGDEKEDRKDEAIVFTDTAVTNPATFLIDDELGRLLDEVPSANILVVIDSCHSGTGTRSPLASYTGARGITIVHDVEPGNSRPGAFGEGLTLRKPVTVISASLAAQKANELSGPELEALGFPSDAPAGLLTTALCEALGRTPDVTFRELSKKITERVEGAVPELKRKKMDSFRRSSQTPHFQLVAENMTIPAFLEAKSQGAGIAAVHPEIAPVAADAVIDPSTGVIRRGAIKVGLTANGARFQTGDKLVVRVTADRDGFLGLFSVNARNEVNQIFPSQQGQNHAIRANQVVQIPAETDDFEYVMGAPFGTETIKAVVATEPFGKLEFSDAHELFWRSAQGAVSRGIDVQGKKGVPAAFSYGEATLTYDVWED